MNTRALKHLGGDTCFPPRRVIDALALAVLGGDLHESVFERLHVVLDLVTPAAETLLQVPPLLDEVDALQRVGFGDARLDVGKTLLEGLGGDLATTARPVPFQRHEVAPYCVSLTATCRERILVLRRQRSFCCSFPGRHRAIVHDCVCQRKLCRRRAATSLSCKRFGSEAAIAPAHPQVGRELP